MCGLGSITLEPQVEMLASKLDKGIDALFKALDHRGGHACGLVMIAGDGKSLVQKAPLAAAKFTADRVPAGSDTRAVMVHTRMATKGAKEWNRNNHPVAGPNGALVMHNGVVYDGHLRRKKGEPEVDTYSLALQVGNARKRHPNELAKTWAARVVREAQKVEGSQVLQIAFREKPIVISANIRSNPLYEATSDGVRVTASTYDSVQRTFDALGITVPTEEYEQLVMGTGKRGKKQRESVKSVRELIFRCQPGDVLLWDAGVHSEFTVGEAAPESALSRSYSGQHAAGAYAAGKASSGSTYSSYGPPGTGSFVEHKFKLDEWVFSSQRDRAGRVRSINNNRAPVLYQVEFKTIAGASTTTVSQHENLLRQATAGEIPATPPSPLQTPLPEVSTAPHFLIGDRVKHKALEREGVVIGISVSTHNANMPVKMYDVFFPQGGGFKELEVTMGGSGLVFVAAMRDRKGLDEILSQKAKSGLGEVEGADYEECEVCRAIDTDWREIDGVLLCSKCAEQVPAWERAGIPAD